MSSFTDLDEGSAYDALLLTDLYQLTMARAHWRTGRLGDEGVFHLYFRRAPFGGAFALAAGVARALEQVAACRFRPDSLAWLAELRAPDGRTPLFEPEFLALLGRTELRLDVDAVPEGTVVLPGVPLVTVRGPLWQAQLVETLLLNLVGFETLVATKAARIVRAAGRAAVLEFGARRAQGPGAAIAASRAAWIGGVAGTSNVLAARVLGIPVRGTHAHAYVQSFAGLSVTTDESERRAFDTFARSMPQGCVLLVDTYDTLDGVRSAIDTARAMRARGDELAGIRLDSGDLCTLATEARRMLDDAGFSAVRIVASDDLDERRIESLVRRGAPIDVFGVGTRLVTGGDQASLGVVYKLAAVRAEGGTWRSVMKLSSEPAKRSLPGDVHVVRVRHGGTLVGDFLHLAEEVRSEPRQWGSPYWGVVVGADSGSIEATLDGKGEPLLVPALREGVRVADFPMVLADARERARRELASLSDDVREFDRPSHPPVLLSRSLAALRAAGAIATATSPVP
jgi:nicotinate phosphoribosyltransferase